MGDTQKDKRNDCFGDRATKRGGKKGRSQDEAAIRGDWEKTVEIARLIREGRWGK